MKPKHIARFILTLIIGGIIFASLACKPSYPTAKKRYDKLTNWYPELIETDTIIVTDTILKETKIRIPEYRDSFIFLHDTFYETKRIIVFKRGNMFGVNVKPYDTVIHDTLIREVAVPGKIVYREPEWQREIKSVLGAIGGFVIGYILVWAIYTIIRRSIDFFR